MTTTFRTMEKRDPGAERGVRREAAESCVLYQAPENLTPGGFPNSRKRDSIHLVVDSGSGAACRQSRLHAKI